GPWNETCQPPWSEKDLRKKIRDTAAQVGTRPGPLSRTDGDSGREPVSVEWAVREAPDDPHRLAQAFLRGGHTGPGQPTPRCCNGDWYGWDGRAYRLVSEGEVRAGLTRAIKEEFDRLNRLERLAPTVVAAEGPPAREPSARKVTTALVANALQALKSETLVPG